MAVAVFFLSRGSFSGRGFSAGAGSSSVFPSAAGESSGVFVSLGIPVYFYEYLVYLYRVTGAHAHVDDRPVGRGRDFNGGLVRFHLEQRLFERDPVTGRNENLYHLSGFDSFSKFGKPELYQFTFLVT